jgi:hypothetical protein
MIIKENVPRYYQNNGIKKTYDGCKRNFLFQLLHIEQDKQANSLLTLSNIGENHMYKLHLLNQSGVTSYLARCKNFSTHPELQRGSLQFWHHQNLQEIETFHKSTSLWT